MKYLKKFESLEIEPKKGDYVFCKDSTWDEISPFLENNIGKIIIKRNDKIPFDVQYQNIPKEFYDYFENPKPGIFIRGCEYDDVLFFAKTESELLLKRQINKFNI